MLKRLDYSRTLTIQVLMYLTQLVILVFVWSKVGVDNPIGDRWSSGPRSNGANSVRKDLCQICVPTVFVLNRGLGGGAAGAKPTYRLLAILPEPEFFFIWTAFLDFGWLKRAELVW